VFVRCREKYEEREKLMVSEKEGISVEPKDSKRV
jgi:hypothetical protein